MKDLYSLERLVRGLNAVVGQAHENEELRTLAWRLDPLGATRRQKMKAFVEEVRRRFVYASDPTHAETVGPVPFEQGAMVDVDDAALFVAACARHVCIPCRIVAARYDRSWTCLVEFRDEDGFWRRIYPLGGRELGDPVETVRGEQER